MSNTVLIRLKGTQLTHELYKGAEQRFLATGDWEIITPGQPHATEAPASGATVQTAALAPPVNTGLLNRRVNFHVGPRSPK